MTPDPTSNSNQESDHDLLIKLTTNIDSIQTTIAEVKTSIGEIKIMCSNRLPHCMGMFATDKVFAEYKKEVNDRFDARDSWAKWSLGLSITSILSILGMIVTLIVKLK